MIDINGVDDAPITVIRKTAEEKRLIMSVQKQKRCIRLLACLLALMMCIGTLAACTPADETVPDGEEPPINDGEDTPPDETPETPPEATLPDDISVVIYTGTEEEKPYIYENNGDRFDTNNNRFFDMNFYIVYRFPTHAQHKTVELTVSLANPYEVSASADGKTYDVLAATTEMQQGAQKLVLDLSEYRPTEGEGYVYIKLGDADKSDGWGGNLPCTVPIKFFSGMSAISVTADETVRKGDLMMYRYDLSPDAPNESEFVFQNSAVYRDEAATPYYLCDATRTLTYLFRGTPGQVAYISVDLSQDFVISVSHDNEHYTTVTDSGEWGRMRDVRGVDLTPYFANESSVYLRFSDPSPEDGWGPQVHHLTYTVLTGEDATAASVNLNDGWKVTADGKTADYRAGEIVKAKTGSTVTFEREINVPAAYLADRAVSFAYIEGVVADTTVTVDGKTAEKVSGMANAITVALPEGLGNADTYTLTVTTKAGESGEVGLWKNVRLGLEDMIAFPETSRTLGETTRPFIFAEQPYDMVQLNALGGNFLSTLFNTELGINSFNTAMALQSRYYVGDTARALIGLAYEEIYSPIVRLEYAMGIYETLVDALVPTDESMCFLKYDTRPKRAVKNGNALRWQNYQDVTEPFLDMYLLPENAAESQVTLSYDKISEDDALNGVVEVSSTSGTALVNGTLHWYSGDADRATTLALTAKGCESYSVKLNFGDYISQGLTMVAADEEIVAKVGKAEVELDATYAYFVVDRQSWDSNGILVVTDVLPTSVRMIPNADGSKYASMVLEFDGGDEPTVSTVCLTGMDVTLDYAYYVAENMVEDFTYGTNGYDPSYICDHSLGGLAAGAYLMKKYDVDGWEDAVERAATALTDRYEAYSTRNYIINYYQSAMAGCHFMVLMDEDAATFQRIATAYADYMVSHQAADGSFTWLESRNPVAILTAYDITGNEKYLDSARRWLEANTYTEDSVIYKGQSYSEPSFEGTGDLILMNRFGYDDPLSIILPIVGDGINDSGFSSYNSDINPYFLGYSLCDLMNVEYALDEKKEILSIGQYCMYDADGNYTVTDCPNVYVNNPFQ